MARSFLREECGKLSESLTVMPVAIRLLHRRRSVLLAVCASRLVGIRNLPCTNCAIFLMTSIKQPPSGAAPAGCAGVRRSWQVQK